MTHFLQIDVFPAIFSLILESVVDVPIEVTLLADENFSFSFFCGHIVCIKARFSSGFSLVCSDFVEFDLCSDFPVIFDFLL